MTAQDVEQAVILPMILAFPAPTHVRGDQHAREALLNVYRKALEQYDAPVLRLAWQHVAAQNQIWCWPVPSEIAAAAEHYQRQQHPGGDDAWVARCTQMADRYTIAEGEPA